jgi:phage terminase large subunit-like protein
MAPSSITLPPKRPIGKWEQLVLERIERDHRTAKERGFVYDADEAESAVRFFPDFCRHHKGEWAGQPLELAGWQAMNVREIFGWRFEETGYRRFRQAWWETPKKNGKTQIAGGVGLRLLAADGEAGGEVYCTATKKDQALLAYRAACEMVRRSPELARFVMVPKGYMRGARMVCGRLGSAMEPLSADHSKLDGINPSGDIRDEVHAWQDHGLPGVLDTAKAARRQPLTLEITTAGVYDQNGVGWQHHDYACNVLDGTFEDDSQYVYIAAADEGDDPYDPATWWKANPNLGVSPKLDFMARMAEKARRQPSFYNDFLRYHLNLWTQQAKRWLPMDRWKEGDTRAPATRAEYDHLFERFVGAECNGGLDLASKLDLAAFVLEFEDPDDEDVIHLLARFWIPEATVEKRVHEGKRFYQTWVEQGWLTATPGDVIDYKWIRREVVELSRRFRIRRISYDSWGATGIATDLTEEDGFEMVECGQGYKSMSEPSKDFEARVTARKVRHYGHPVLRWNASNSVTRRDPAGNIKPDKEKAKDKIDGIVAAIMAHSRALLDPDGGSSYLESGEGLLVL